MFQFAAEIELVRVIVDFTGSVVHAVPVTMLSDWLVRVIDAVRGRAAELGRRPAIDLQYRRTPDSAVDVRARIEKVDDPNTRAVAEQAIKMIKSVDDKDDKRDR